MTFTVDHAVLIGGLALLTLVFRLGGYFGGAVLVRYPLAKRIFDVLPQLILAALVAQSLSQASFWLWAVAAICLAISLVLRNVLVTMLVGVALVLALNALSILG